MEGAIPKSVADSLNNVIADLQNKIANNPTRVVYSGGSNKKEIESLKEEIAALQSKYDALLKERDALKTEIEKLATDYNNLSQEKTTLANTNKGLQAKVDLAAQLKFSDAMLSGYKLNKKGVKSFEEKAKKVMGFEISFKIQENLVAEEGEKQAFIVITGPYKKVLAESSANVFQVGGIDKVFSIQKSFYFNSKLALISADYKTAEILKDGEYTAEIYVDGKLCGTAVNYLKK
jgi:cell division protein FtsB